jgi:hypothetical protein
MQNENLTLTGYLQLPFCPMADVTHLSCSNLDAIDLPIVDPEVSLLCKLPAQRFEHASIVGYDPEPGFLMAAVPG